MSYNKPPAPMFEVGKEYDAPVDIVDSGRVAIMGVEWGPDNKHLLTRTTLTTKEQNNLKRKDEWVYHVRDIVDDYGRHRFCMTETKLKRWNDGSGED